MSHINTISEFLLQAGTDYRVFDMGRAIRPLSSQTFLDIELTHLAPPYPRQQHGWFGIIFFNPSANQQHYIWFVKLPLDEQGLLISAARNHFLQIVVDALGKQLEKNTDQNTGLPENPYTFKPTQQQLADFNSISRLSLGLAPSQFYELTKQYLQQPNEYQWQNLSIQGIADLAARYSQDKLNILLKSQFPHLAFEVQYAFCTSLENHPVDSEISELLIDWWQQNPTEQQRLLALFRALSQSTAEQQLKSILLEILNSEHLINTDILVLIAARHWSLLLDGELMGVFIKRAVEHDTALFIGLFSDLVKIPNIREAMLQVLRWPNKTHLLTQAIEKLFKAQIP